MNVFYPIRLTQARSWNSMSLDYLAGMIGVTKASISLYERGTRKPDAFIQVRLANALQFPVEFFYTPPIDTSVSQISYRKKANTKKARQIRAELFKQFSIEFVELLSSYVHFKDTSLSIDDVVSPEDLSGVDIEMIALKARQQFNAGLGPIQNVMTFLENRGAFIFLYDSNFFPMDGFSCIHDGHPYIYINQDSSWDRIRLTLAHELGHILLHSGVDRSARMSAEFYTRLERQANRFAGAFLCPKDSFLKEFICIDPSVLLELKKKWGVSKAALVKRARQLNLITATQEKSYFTGASRRKERIIEEGNALRAKEEPFVIKTILKSLLSQQIIDRYFLNARCNLSADLTNVLSFGVLQDMPAEEPLPPFTLQF